MDSLIGNISKQKEPYRLQSPYYLEGHGDLVRIRDNWGGAGGHYYMADGVYLLVGLCPHP